MPSREQWSFTLNLKCDGGFWNGLEYEIDQLGLDRKNEVSLDNAIIDCIEEACMVALPRKETYKLEKSLTLRLWIRKNGSLNPGLPFLAMSIG